MAQVFMETAIVVDGGPTTGIESFDASANATFRHVLPLGRALFSRKKMG